MCSSAAVIVTACCAILPLILQSSLATPHTGECSGECRYRYLREPPSDINCNSWSTVSELKVQCQASVPASTDTAAEIHWFFNSQRITSSSFPPLESIAVASDSIENDQTIVTSTLALAGGANDKLYSGNYYCLIQVNGSYSTCQSNVLRLRDQDSYIFFQPCYPSSEPQFRMTNRCVGNQTTPFAPSTVATTTTTTTLASTAAELEVQTSSGESLTSTAVLATSSADPATSDGNSFISIITGRSIYSTMDDKTSVITGMGVGLVTLALLSAVLGVTVAILCLKLKTRRYKAEVAEIGLDQIAVGKDDDGVEYEEIKDPEADNLLGTTVIPLSFSSPAMPRGHAFRKIPPSALHRAATVASERQATPPIVPADYEDMVPAGKAFCKTPLNKLTIPADYEIPTEKALRKNVQRQAVPSIILPLDYEEMRPAERSVRKISPGLQPSTVAPAGTSTIPQYEDILPAERAARRTSPALQPATAFTVTSAGISTIPQYEDILPASPGLQPATTTVAQAGTSTYEDILPAKKAAPETSPATTTDDSAGTATTSQYEDMLPSANTSPGLQPATTTAVPQDMLPAANTLPGLQPTTTITAPQYEDMLPAEAATPAQPSAEYVDVEAIERASDSYQLTRCSAYGVPLTN